MITIFLADDHTLVRQALRLLLESEEGFSVVGEAGTGPATLRGVEKLEPDLLILDVVMPGLDGLEVTRRISRGNLRTRILLLSMQTTESFVLEAFRRGASGYICKDACADDLADAVRSVTGGKHYLSPMLALRAVEEYVEAARQLPPDAYDMLTDREREVLQLTAEGHPTRGIAELLFISPRTVETHRASMMRKLQLSGQTDLIRYAVRKGLLPPG